MNDNLRAFTRWLGFPGLRFDLDARSRTRILWVSALPALIVCAVLIQIALIFVFDYLPAYPGDAAPEFWRRTSDISVSVIDATPLAVAVLIGAGVRPWSRPEGSWLLLIGLALAFTSFGLAMASAWISAVFDFDDAETLRLGLWQSYIWEPGFLAIGYFFLAYRALSGRPSRRPESRARRANGAPSRSS